jgi:hypothetical protein
MNTDKINTLLRLAELLAEDSSCAQPAQPAKDAHRRVIVRGDRSGVFYGDLLERNGQEVTLGQCRHIWYWSGAANTAEIANSGVSKPSECKIVGPVSRVLILDAVEVLDCTAAAIASLDAVPHWSRR